MPRSGTGTSWPGTCARSTPRPPPRPRGRRSRSWRTSGARPTRPSRSCGGRRGTSSSEFLDYDIEIRTVLCSTNAIESLNARYRRAVNAKGHFPTEQAALKTLYLVTRSLDPKGLGQARWVTRWKPALNAFAVTFTTACQRRRPCNDQRRLHPSSDTPAQAQAPRGRRRASTTRDLPQACACPTSTTRRAPIRAISQRKAVALQGRSALVQALREADSRADRRGHPVSQHPVHTPAPRPRLRPSARGSSQAYVGT
jgi:hypothetical protein